MNLFRLSVANLAMSPLSTAVNILLLSLGTASIAILLIATYQLTNTLTRDSADIDLVIGAKGSPLQLVLAGVYHADVPPGNIPLDEAEPWMNHSQVESATPLALGDSFRGFRIVGTNHDYIDIYDGEMATGRLWDKPLEIVVGATVSAETGMRIGDTLVGTHGLEEDGHAHDDQKYTVVGVLAETGTVLDRLLVTSMESVWILHETGHHDHDHGEHDHHSDHEEHDHSEHAHEEHDHKHDEHDHSDHEGHDHSEHAHEEHDHKHDDHGEHEHKHDDHDHSDHEGHDHSEHAHEEHDHKHDDHDHSDHEGHDHSEHAHEEHDHKHDDHDHSDHEGHDHSEHAHEEHDHTGHDHGEHEGQDATVILVTYSTPMAALNLPREINESSALQAASPAFEITRLLQIVGIGIGWLQAFAGILLASAALSIFAALYASLKARRHDLAVLRCLGATRWELFTLLFVEGMVLTISGIGVGLIAAHGGLELIGMWLGDNQIALTGLVWAPAEFGLIAGLLTAGVLTAILPAWQAFSTDVSRTLSAP